MHFDRRYVQRGLLAGLIALMSACGGERYLTTPDNAKFRMPELEKRSLVIRYTDREGRPVTDNTVRFSLQGDAKGATLDPVVARTDSDGLAKTTLTSGYDAAFEVRAEADWASPLAVAITVAHYYGGKLIVDVQNGSSTKDALETEVRLVDEVQCSSLKLVRLPTPTRLVREPSRKVTLNLANVAATEVDGVPPGQRYSVVAIGRKNNRPVAMGCASGIEMKQGDIDREIPQRASVTLENVAFDISPSDLVAQTSFTFPFRFGRLANTFKRMSDEEGDPTKYILERTLDKTDSVVATIIGGFLPSLIQYIGSKDTSKEVKRRQELTRFHQALESIKNVEMASTMTLMRGAAGELPAGTEWQIVHRFRHLEAEVLGSRTQFNLSPVVFVGESPEPVVLEARAPVRVQKNLTVAIDAHELSIPVKDAVIGNLLKDVFGEPKLKDVLSDLFNCTTLADLAAEYVAKEVSENVLAAGAARAAIAAGCKPALDEVLGDIQGEIANDIEEANFAGRLRFEGSADVELLPDASNIDLLTNGQWLGVGPFSARKQ